MSSTVLMLDLPKDLHQSMVVGATGTMGEVADDGWSTSVPQVSHNK